MGKILITGVAGFIGAKTAEMLLELGNEVIGIDNINDYYDVRVKQYRLEGLKAKRGFVFYQSDIEDIVFIEALANTYRIDAVINLAARAGVRYSLQVPHLYMSTNVMGTLNLLEVMRHKGINKFVLASTSSLYAGHPLPFKEDAPVNRPISPYAASKKAAEAIAYSYHHLYGIDVSVLRYFTVYGPAGRPDMSPFRFIKWIDEGYPIELYGDGSQRRDFTYIDDIARGTVSALKTVGYEIINLGGGKGPYSMNQLIEKIELLLGKKATINYMPFHRADMTETGADISVAKELLNWQPEVSLEEGLEETVRWHVNNRHWIKEIRP
jgi:nucleoside-diphosphate-sugar epimerase